MNAPAHGLTVCLVDREVWLKVSGRANFTFSVDFKTVVHKLRDQGYRRFVLDLTDCLLMDSTFLGVMAGMGLRFAHTQNGETSSMELLNPNARILDLLENLGVNQLFQVRQGSSLANHEHACVERTAGSADKTELARTCLEAHETLMHINPANIAKFKDVTKFLAEDLKRLEEEKKASTPSGEPSPVR